MERRASRRGVVDESPVVIDSFQKIRSARECDARGESERAREGSARRR